MAALGIDIDLCTDFLEDHWGDELKCESSHRQRENLVCSADTFSRLVSCGKVVLACGLATGWHVTHAPHYTCDKCGRNAALCLVVIPV